MITLVLLFVASVIFVEGVTELICKSSLFFGLRAKLSALHPFIKELLGCGYCTSFWAASIPAGFFAVKMATCLLTIPVWFLFLIIVIQRLSNFLHNTSDKHFDKFYDKRMSGKDGL